MSSPIRNAALTAPAIGGPNQKPEWSGDPEQSSRDSDSAERVSPEGSMPPGRVCGHCQVTVTARDDGATLSQAMKAPRQLRESEWIPDGRLRERTAEDSPFRIRMRAREGV